MAYAPQNTKIFTAAFAGALAGMGASNRLPFQSDAADYELIAQVAGAFAQAFDTEWGAVLVASDLDLGLTAQLCEVIWQDRAPTPVSPLLSADTFSAEAEALKAMVLAARQYYTDEGITPPPYPGGEAAGDPGDAQFAAAGGAFTESPTYGNIKTDEMRNVALTTFGTTRTYEVGGTALSDGTPVDLLLLNGAELGAPWNDERVHISIDVNLNGMGADGDFAFVKSFRSFDWNGDEAAVTAEYDQESNVYPVASAVPAPLIELNGAAGIRVRASGPPAVQTRWYGTIMVTVGKVFAS